MRDLISALGSDEIAEDHVLAALRKGLEEYRRDYFKNELYELRSSDQIDALLDDLRTFQSTLNIDITREIEATIEAKDEFEEKEAAYGDHMQDEWKERNYETRADETSVREMFASLTSDRKH